MRTSPFAFMRMHYSALILILSVFVFATVTLAAIISGNVSTNSSVHVTYTLVTVDRPASVAAGDLLLANIAINGGSPASVTAPSGWTQVLRADNDTNVSLISYYKVAGASEPSNYTWTIDTQTRAEGGITQYSGVDTSNPIDIAAGNFGRGKIATTSLITTSFANEEVVDSFAFDAGTSTAGYFSTPTGMTEKYDVTYPTVGPSLATDDTLQVATGTVGSVSSTIAGNKNRNWASLQIALRRQIFAPSVNGDVTTQAVNTGCVGSGTASSTTFSHTVASGDNQVLIITSGAETIGGDTGATYDGVAMMRGHISSNTDGTEALYAYWYLVNPPQGTHDVVIAFPDGGQCRQYAAITVQNVDQTIPFDTDGHVGGLGGNPSIPVTTTEANELILYFLDYDDRPTNTVYTPNDPSLYWVNNDSTGATLGNQGAVHTQSTAGTVSVGGTRTGASNGPWDLIAVPIRPAN
jgi:hypothetical protein